MEVQLVRGGWWNRKRGESCFVKAPSWRNTQCLGFEREKMSRITSEEKTNTKSMLTHINKFEFILKRLKTDL